MILKVYYKGHKKILCKTDAVLLILTISDIRTWQCLSFEFDGFQAVALKHYKWLEKLA